MGDWFLREFGEWFHTDEAKAHHEHLKRNGEILKSNGEMNLILTQ
jgi:hypothetical protein